MNQRSDIDRVLKVWMADGPSAIPDRVVDVIATRIAVQRQRRAWPFPGRTTMTTQIKLIAGLAAALVVAVVGYNLLPGTTGPGTPTAVPTVSAQPSAGPPASPVADLPDGILQAGRYRMDLSFIEPGLSVLADVPAGWQGEREVPALLGPGATSNDGVLIGFMAADTLFSDPCNWDLDGSGDRGQPGDIAVEPDRFRLADTLRSNPAYTYIRSEPYSIDGFPAFDVELQLPGSDVLAACDRSPDTGAGGDFLVFGGGFWAQGPDNHWRLSIIEVDGSLLVALVSSFGETSELHVSAGQAIVDTLDIMP
jgi:hypothetical protein